MSITFVYKAEAPSRVVLPLNGSRSCAVVNRCHAITPAAITRAELQQLMAEYTVCERDVEDETPLFSLTFPGLHNDSLAWREADGAHQEEEAAQFLNDFGVSISDWPAYNLTDNPMEL